MINIFHYLIISLAINILMFVIAYKKKTDKLTDITFALTFILLTMTALAANIVTLHKIMLAAMILIWAARLGLFLFIRIRKNRDRRFDGIRDNFIRFLKFWTLQGMTAWLMLIPALLFMQTQGRLSWPGIAIWIAGITIESIADQQKSNHKGLIRSGLWKYSRHPNYFGEILCWTGIYIAVFATLTSAQKIIALASPLSITTLLLFITGIPQLEKRAMKKWPRQYTKYRQQTSMIIPWFRSPEKYTQ